MNSAQALPYPTLTPKKRPSGTSSSAVGWAGSVGPDFAICPQQRMPAAVVPQVDEVPALIDEYTWPPCTALGTVLSVRESLPSSP